MPEKIHAYFFLILATLIWGGSFPVIKLTLQNTDPLFLIFSRFLIAFTGSLIILILLKKKKLKPSHVYSGFLLGILAFLGYYTQTLGLVYTTPHRSAFLTQTLVVFVFFFQVLFLKKPVSFLQGTGIGFILLGNFIMFLFAPSQEQEAKHNFLTGDVLTIISASGFAFYIIMIDRIPREEFLYPLTTHFFVVSFLGFVFCRDKFTPISFSFEEVTVWGILYLGIFSTLLTTFLMFFFQPKLTPVQASIIYALEPVFATLLSFILMHTTIHAYEITGSLFIFFGSLLGDMPLSLKKKH